MGNEVNFPMGATRERVRFKNLSHFETIAEAKQMVNVTGDRWRFDDQDCLCVSDIIDDNCFIVRRQFSDTAEPIYLCHFIGVTGHVELIRASLDKRFSYDLAESWLLSDDFRRNKEKYLAQNSFPIHEQDEADVLKYCGNDRDKQQYKKHLIFVENFHAWLKQLPPEKKQA